MGRKISRSRMWRSLIKLNIKQTNKTPKKANSVFFSLVWNKPMVQSQYLHCSSELLRAALDFNDFGEREGGGIITHPNSLPVTHRWVLGCFSPLQCLFGFLNRKMRFSNFTSNELEVPVPYEVFTFSVLKTSSKPFHQLLWEGLFPSNPHWNVK